jgi:hypothetical protein
MLTYAESTQGACQTWCLYMHMCLGILVIGMPS